KNAKFKEGNHPSAKAVVTQNLSVLCHRVPISSLIINKLLSGATLDFLLFLIFLLYTLNKLLNANGPQLGSLKKSKKIYLYITT
ncbi:hypothetical protein, partial [Photobacterium alginatilyticum]|uniref:hypothetical protein n=1 Tax=Photobacterium alginatilyticum TaxID=1775171 RepID=UPI001964E5FF